MEIYQDERGEYRWRLKAQNGRIVGASSEGFSTVRGAMKNASRVQTLLAEGIEDLVSDDGDEPEEIL